VALKQRHPVPCETVKVKRGDRVITINKSDYDPKQHSLASGRAPEPPPVQPPPVELADAEEEEEDAEEKKPLKVRRSRSKSSQGE
jgi:hypothetical protein